MERQNKGIVGNITAQPFAFAIAFFVFFFIIVMFLGFVDALPEPSQITAQAQTASKPQTSTPVVATTPENPVRIVATKVGMDTKVNNPSETSVEALDESLLSGAVRYPTSAKLGANGTVLLFGHSSYLPVIHNQAYKAFKGIQNLSKGDVITVYSGTTEYRYEVETVSLANANEDVVELRQDGKYLTLVTCDTFAKKSDRFVVTAKLVGTYKLTQ
ncbi:MAG: sortase [Patescibacteria group bacterium]